MNKIEARSIIDTCYYQIEQIENKLDQRTELDKMIDNACDMDKESLETVIELTEQVIEAKKAICYDTTWDEKHLNIFKQALWTNLKP